MENRQDENWQRFARIAQNYNSRYLTVEDRFQMVKDIYMLEGGNVKSDFQKEYKEINDELATIILRREKDFPWEDFVKDFAHRGNVDLIEVIARDLLMIKQIQEMYKRLVTEEIDEHFTSKNTLEVEAFKLAYYLDFKDKYSNYFV